MVRGFGPLLVIAAAVLGKAAHKCVSLGRSWMHLYLGALEGVPLALIISYFYMPSVSMSIFQSWL